MTLDAEIDVERVLLSIARLQIEERRHFVGHIQPFQTGVSPGVARPLVASESERQIRASIGPSPVEYACHPKESADGNGGQRQGTGKKKYIGAPFRLSPRVAPPSFYCKDNPSE